MSITFGTSVAVNNILALRAMYTFIFNYNLHEKPTFYEKWFLPPLKLWIERKAIYFLDQIQTDQDVLSASVSLNDVSGDFFAVLVLAQQPHLTSEVKSGQELFLLLAQMALEFEKVKKPRDSINHGA